MGYHASRVSKSLKVTGTDVDRSATYDFILVIRSNQHGPISYRFRDKRRCRLKIANFPTPVSFNDPLRDFPGNFWTAAGLKKTIMMLLADGVPSFRYNTVTTDGRTDVNGKTTSPSACRACRRAIKTFPLRSSDCISTRISSTTDDVMFPLCLMAELFVCDGWTA